MCRLSAQGVDDTSAYPGRSAWPSGRICPDSDADAQVCASVRLAALLVRAQRINEQAPHLGAENSYRHSAVPADLARHQGRISLAWAVAPRIRRPQGWRRPSSTEWVVDASTPDRSTDHAPQNPATGHLIKPGKRPSQLAIGTSVNATIPETSSTPAREL